MRIVPTIFFTIFITFFAYTNQGSMSVAEKIIYIIAIALNIIYAICAENDMRDDIKNLELEIKTIEKDIFKGDK